MVVTRPNRENVSRKLLTAAQFPFKRLEVNSDRQDKARSVCGVYNQANQHNLTWGDARDTVNESMRNDPYTSAQTVSFLARAHFGLSQVKSSCVGPCHMQVQLR